MQITIFVPLQEHNQDAAEPRIGLKLYLTDAQPGEPGGSGTDREYQAVERGRRRLLGEARYSPPAEAVCTYKGCSIDARGGECGPRQAGELDRGRRGRQV